MSRVWWFLLIVVVFCILFTGIQAEVTAEAEGIENNLVDGNQVAVVKNVVLENETNTRKGAEQPRVLQETGAFLGIGVKS